MFRIREGVAQIAALVVLCLVLRLDHGSELPLPVEVPQVNPLSVYDPGAFDIAEFLIDRVGYQSDMAVLDLSQLILLKSAEIGVEPHVLLGVIDVESTFDACARSHVGALGLMQVMPYRILGRDEARQLLAFNSHLTYDPYWNVAFGAQYLGELIQRFDSVETALAAYNAGPTRVAKILLEDGFVSSPYAHRVIRAARRIEVELNI